MSKKKRIGHMSLPSETCSLVIRDVSKSQVVKLANTIAIPCQRCLNRPPLQIRRKNISNFVFKTLNPGQCCVSKIH